MHTLAPQFIPDLHVVVDLTVEDHAVAPIGGTHRLVAACRQVNDRETLKAQRDIRINIEAIVVWAPGTDALGGDTHPLELWPFLRLQCPASDHSPPLYVTAL